jgi:hypothetical protein
MPKRRTWITALILLAATAVSAVLFGPSLLLYLASCTMAIDQPAEPDRTPSFIVPLRTPGWRQRDDLLIRAGDDTGGNLLLWRMTTGQAVARFSPEDTASRPACAGPVYLYTPGAFALSPVDSAVWDEADSKVCDCLAQYAAPIEPFQFSYGDTSLRHEGHLAPTKGKYVMAVVASPSRGYVAVVSADGPFDRGGDGMLMFGGGRGARGTHYQELFMRTDASAVGQPIVLPWTTAHDSNLIPCWSADERYIVYRDRDGIEILILETGLQREEQSP